MPCADRSRRHPTSVSHRALLPSSVSAAPHHLLPTCAGARREELPYHRNLDHLRRHDPLIRERRCHPCFSTPSRWQEARVSCRLHPLVRRVASPPWMLECPSSPHLSPGSAATGHAVMGARRAMAASVRTRAPCQRTGHGPVPLVGRGHHYGEATGWASRRYALALGPSFGPSDLKSFSIFQWI
jgi:hypothetical protein